MTGAAWRRPLPSLALEPDHVHVWRISFADARAERTSFAATLADDERARAARFLRDRDRDAFTITRGALRTLLARYTGHAPGAIELGYRGKGKPYLVTPADSVRFNVSHSGDHAVLAFVRDRELGVDIEHRRPLSDLLPLARISFSPSEYATLCALPSRDHPGAFYTCWSRKEAFIKATGEGISQLNDFDVTLRADQPAQILRVAGPPSEHARWSLTDLPVIQDYAAALVVEGHGLDIHPFTWPPD
jgi:4'-phosphopantetheinyl transferase